MSYLILQIFPSFVGMVAIYVILLRIKGLDTLWGLVLVYVAGNIPYNTWLVKNYMDTVSKSLDEAARIDGASHLNLYDDNSTRGPPHHYLLAIVSFTAPWITTSSQDGTRSGTSKPRARSVQFVTDKKTSLLPLRCSARGHSVHHFLIVTQRTMITSFGTSAVKIIPTGRHYS